MTQFSDILLQDKQVGVKIKFVYYKLNTTSCNSNFSIRNYIDTTFTLVDHLPSILSTSSFSTQVDDGSLLNCDVIQGKVSMVSEHGDSASADTKDIPREYKSSESGTSRKTRLNSLYIKGTDSLIKGTNSQIKGTNSLIKGTVSEGFEGRSYRKIDTTSSRTVKLQSDRKSPDPPSRTPTPEMICSSVNFFTEYNIGQSPRTGQSTSGPVLGSEVGSVTSSCSQSSVATTGVQNGLFKLTEPNEHVIYEDDDKLIDGLDRPQDCIDAVFGRSKAILPPISSKTKTEKKKAIPEKEPPRKSLPVYLRIVESKKRMIENEKKEVSFDEIINTISECNTPSVTTTEKSHASSLKNVANSFHHLPRFSPVPTCFHLPVDRFQDMNIKGSIPKLKKLKRYDAISRISEAKTNRAELMQFLENFIEETHLPKLQTIFEKPVPSFALHPKAFEPKFDSAEALKLKRERMAKESEKEDKNPFSQRIPSDFEERLLQACDDFLIRKELVTCQDTWKTITYVTINRIIPCRFGNVEIDRD